MRAQELYTYPVLLTHDLDACLFALSTMQEVNTPVQLQNPPQSITYLGPLYIKTMFEEAFKTTNFDTPPNYCIDCDSNVANALITLRLHPPAIRLNAPTATYDKIATIAEQANTQLLPTATHIFDVSQCHRDKARLHTWLAAMKH